MRLLVIEPGLRLWGSERALLATLPALIASYEQVILLTPSGAELAQEARKLGATVRSAPIGHLHRRGLAPRLLAFMSILVVCLRYRVARIYLNQAGLCRLVAPAAAILRLPLVIHVRLAEDISRCARLKSRRGAPLGLILISDDMRRLYESSCEPGGADVRTVYDMYEFARLNSSAAPGSTFVCVGRIAKIKGQAELLLSFSAALKIRPDLRLDLIGSAAPGDPYEQRVLDLVRDLGLRDHVGLAGYATDVAERLSNYAFAVIPSLYEPLGRVVMEAWEAGVVPIVGEGSGGAAELVRLSGGGILYDNNDPNGLPSALVDAAGMSEAERARRISLGRDWARDRLGARTYRSALEGLLFGPELTLARPNRNLAGVAA